MIPFCNVLMLCELPYANALQPDQDRGNQQRKAEQHDVFRFACTQTEAHGRRNRRRVHRTCHQHQYDPRSPLPDSPTRTAESHAPEQGSADLRECQRPHCVGDILGSLAWLERAAISPEGEDFSVIASGLYDKVLNDPRFKAGLQRLRTQILIALSARGAS